MVHLFNAGPAKVPDEVKEQIQSEFFNFAGSGISVIEISHRSPEFTALMNESNVNLREILEIPDNYRILWLAGGATGLFSSIPLNLITSKDDVLDYVVTGTWSKGAAKEAEKYANVNYVVPIPADFTGVPLEESMKFTPGAKYVFYCDNETVNGIEFPHILKTDSTIVCDMSSNFLSRAVDVQKYGAIFAGVQKNVAPAGLGVLIIREDLISADRLHQVPKVWDFKLQDAANSCLNTPNVFSLYVTNLVLKHLMKNGGLKRYSELSRQKSSAIYDIIDDSNGFYACKIDKDARSRMNVTFKLASKDLEAEFVKKAADLKIEGVKGHRSVGGIRASLYNAVTMESVNYLGDFMKSFQKNHE
ncbi:probable phosphoserine aminotransferase [Bolinopsis microptera]|uniref:probable phosphoserine aminotransferase n=1 Tax=Bolinopsis microptera TaxID=2820187 RepID=UPI00307AA49D